MPRCFKKTWKCGGDVRAMAPFLLRRWMDYFVFGSVTNLEPGARRWRRKQCWAPVSVPGGGTNGEYRYGGSKI